MPQNRKRTPSPTAAQTLPVFRAEHFVATDGANMGDALTFAAELVLDDIYSLRAASEPLRMSVVMQLDSTLVIAPNTDVGVVGSAVHLDCALTLMSPEGHIQDAMVLVQVDDQGHVDQVYLMPLAPIGSGTEYRLVGIDTDTVAQKFAQVACVSFSRGTQITMASGAQRAVENLVPGDLILTRDDGMQELRWVGHSTVRAVGDFSPIRIRAGTLNNTDDLLVSPDHRLFIYQRNDRIGAGQSELLVKARHLVNGSSVTVEDGGFVDYVQLLFDRHQIIYAEGIAAESMLVDSRTRPVLPDNLSEALADLIDSHARQLHGGIDVQESLLNRPDVADLLRRASRH